MYNKYILSGVSILIGGAVGYFIGHKVAMNKAQKIADEQVEDVKKALKDLYEDRIKEAREKDLPKNEEDEDGRKNAEMGVDPGINDIDSRSRFPRPSKTIQSASKTIEPKIEAPTDKEHEKLMKRPTDLPPDAIDTLDGYPDPDDVPAKSLTPYLLREKDFDTIDNFDTLELILWADGQVSVNDSYCELVSPTKLFELLPENWVNMFDWDKTGKYASVIYFRNNKERVDIEIIKDVRTYKEWLEEVYPGRASELE